MSAAALRLAARQSALPTRPVADPLLARAQRLWPDNDYLQREWLRAVRVVRNTRRGWLADVKVDQANAR